MIFRRLNIVEYIKKPTSKWQIKVFLAFAAMAIVIAVIILSQLLIDNIIKKEKNIIRTFAKIYENIEYPDENVENYLLLLKEISSTVTFPVIMTNADNEPSYPFESYTLNVEIDTSLTVEQQRKYLDGLIRNMQEQYEPVVTMHEGKVLQKFYYTHSTIVESLRYFPLFAFISIALIIFIGYISFSNIRRNEESKVWIGMSKEAAHQLGTPLSSMMAWIEILRYNIDNPKSISDTLSEMDKDIIRLNTIANRFAKIGSEPNMEVQDVSYVVESACNYFDKRLPHLGRKVTIVRDFDKARVYANINTDLFTWVLENLIKNAAEAIEGKKGVITISMVKEAKRVQITVKDNGKGMTNRVKKQIFNPGFTTKKRGWGLGLSLCKRIIEQYHKGKIYVKETAPGAGTTFLVEVPVAGEGIKSLTHHAN